MAPTLGSFDRIEPFAVVAAVGTTPAAPHETDVSFTPGSVVHLEVLVPPGHNGATGFRVAQAHQAIYPDRVGAFIVASGEKFEWDMEDDIDNGNWQLVTYNVSRVPHTFYLRFYVVENSKLRAGEAPLLTPLSL